MFSARFLITVTVLLLGAFWAFVAVAQLDWNRYPGNPVFPPGLPGEWDEGFVVANTVMYHEGMYKMWYEGAGGFGYATSLDGIDWSRYANNPVLEPGPGWWNVDSVASASVVFIGDTYYMWYSGIDGEGENRIGRATSPDGITWTKDPAEPVLDLGDIGDWDSQEAMHPFVLFEDPVYHMWYNGHDGVMQRILYASSADGISWSRFTAYPPLEPGLPGTWDSGLLGPMWVVHVHNLYLMWYTALDQADVARIGFAWSPDGTSWTKAALHNPVLESDGSGNWDHPGVALPVVLLEGTEYVMWYGGGDIETPFFQVGLATSLDVVPVHETPGDHPGRSGIAEPALAQNYPNPFNPVTVIPYELPAQSTVSLHIYDVSGRLVRTLLAGETVEPGRHTVSWHGRSNNGQDVATGIYYYKLSVDSISQTRRMILVR